METITSKQEISDLFSSGKRFHTPYLTFIVLPTKRHDLNGRVAFIAGKKLGNAVWRNRAKRRMREACYLAGGPWKGFDVVFLAKRNVNSITFKTLVSVCTETAQKAGFVRDSVYDRQN
ncbi:ribonuclease P protein component [Adlercreutzia sp. ZJ141]|uniref:ribonuclease P protein component n=1 Tax=Adlercreutzia sp. ZJ141 TaxID=2709406 RepID=UPI0013EDBB2A|nr:ribonuclease P protein component [Adlercreutzia sp. ZJ141]